MSAVRHDVFPALVAVLHETAGVELTDLRSAPLQPKTAHQLQKARVVVFNDRVTIAVDGDAGPRIVFNQKIQPGSFIKGASVKDDSFVMAENGAMIAYRKDENCGCGSRLRSWNPYRTVHSNKNPTE